MDISTAPTLIWNAVPPPGISFQIHKFCFLDALPDALSIAGYPSPRERKVAIGVLAGAKAFVVISTLPMYMKKDGRNGKLLNFEITASSDPAHDDIAILDGHAVVKIVGWPNIAVTPEAPIS